MGATSTTSADGKMVTIKVTGRFDFNLHKEFRQAYAGHAANGARYAVDLSGVDYLDSSALGMLLLLREHAGGERASIAIGRCSPGIAKILQIANFQRLFALEPTA